MKIELDKMRAVFARQYDSIKKGIGAGDKAARVLMQS